MSVTKICGIKDSVFRDKAVEYTVRCQGLLTPGASELIDAYQTRLDFAFDWTATEEGWIFWSNIYHYPKCKLSYLCTKGIY